MTIILFTNPTLLSPIKGAFAQDKCFRLTPTIKLLLTEQKEKNDRENKHTYRCNCCFKS